MRAPLMETQQHGSIRITNLTKVIMARRRFGLPKERLVPFEADRNVFDADDRPCALHCVSGIGITDNQTLPDSLIRKAFESNLVIAISVFLRSKCYQSYRAAGFYANDPKETNATVSYGAVQRFL